MSILTVILNIGTTIFVVSFIAVLIGQRVGLRFRGLSEGIGGQVLIAAGVSILRESFANFRPLVHADRDVNSRSTTNHDKDENG